MEATLENNSKKTIKIAIFASGAGSNAKKILEHFTNYNSIHVALVVCNKPGAGVLEIATHFNVEVLLLEKEKFFRGNGYVDEFKAKDIGVIVLAGFLWKIPKTVITAYTNRIINIHPALLPKYGGKGMYGLKVHEAVIEAGEKESGITIHLVDEYYDNGDIIFQVKCAVLPGDTPDGLAERIHKLEHENFARVVEEYVSKMIV